MNLFATDLVLEQRDHFSKGINVLNLDEQCTILVTITKRAYC